MKNKMTPALLLILGLMLTGTVQAQVSADFKLITPGDSCGSRSVKFDASVSTGNISTYQWVFKDKSSGANLGSGSGALILKNFLSPGTYSATLTVSGPGGSNSKTRDVRVYKKPVVDFSVDKTEGCPPLGVTFTDKSSAGNGSISSWEWNYNDGTKETFTTKTAPAHSYTKSSRYSPTLIVTNSFGCTSSTSKNDLITVYEKVKPSFIVRDNYRCSVPHTVSFDNISPLSGPFTYIWYFGDGDTLASNNAQVTHTYTKAGRYSIRLKAINAPGTCSDETISNSSQEVYVGEPSTDFKLPTRICVGERISIPSDADPNGLTNTGRWLFGDDNSTYNGTTGYHTFSKPGKWKVSYFAFSTYSDCKTDTITREINVLASPVADASANLEKGCKTPHKVTFTNKSTGATKYEWNFGDGTAPLTVTHKNPVSHSYNSFGYFTVTLKAINAANCSHTKYLYIRNQKPSVDFEFAPEEGCKPLKVDIKVNASSIDPITKYIYAFSDGTTDILNAPKHSHTFTTSGAHDITVSIETAQKCTAVSDTKPLTVIDVCSDDGSGGGGGGGGGGIGVGGGGSADCGKKYTFTFSDTLSTATVISWDFDGDLKVTSQNPITYTFPNNVGKKKFLVTATLKEKPPGTATLKHQVYVKVVDEKAAFTQDKSDICKGLDVGFIPVGIDSSNIKTYTWDFGDSTQREVIDNEAYFNANLKYLNGSTKHVYPDTGTYYTKLIIEDKFGCLDSVVSATPIKVKGPVAKFTLSDSSFCSNDIQVSFQDSSQANGTVPILKREWNLGDGTIFTSASDSGFIHPYKHNGTYQAYTASLHIEDQLGCKDTYEREITSYAPKANFWSRDTLRCNKFDIFLYNSSSARVSDYQRYTWKYSDGQTSKGYYGSHTFKSNSAYSVTLTVEDDGGCIDSLTKKDYIKLVRPKAKFDIGADTSKCVGTFSLPFISTSTYSDQFSWDFGDSSFSTTKKVEVSHFYENAGIYEVKLKVDGIDGCQDSTTQKVRIKGPRGKLLIDDYYLCLGADFESKVDGYNIKDFYWDFDDLSPTGSLTKKDSVVHRYKKTGKYIPNVILLSPENCQITLRSADTVYVDQLDAGPDFLIPCGDSLATLQGKTALNLANNYFWSGPSGAVFNPDSSSLTTTVDTPGDYILRVKGDKCPNTDTIRVSSSGVIPTVDAGLDVKIDCIKDKAQLSGSTTTADTRLKWSGPSGATLSPHDSSSNISVSLPGKYVLEVTQKLCTSLDTVVVRPCGLDAQDTAIAICANIPGTPANYKGYSFIPLSSKVMGSVAAQVSWYRDPEFALPLGDPGNELIKNGTVYYAKVTSLDSSETDRARVGVTVHDFLEAEVLRDRDTICTDQAPLYLRPRSVRGKKPHYEWYKGADLLKEGISPQSLKITEPGQSGRYVLKVSSEGCLPDADTLQVMVYEKPRPSFPTPAYSVLYGTGTPLRLDLNLGLDNPMQLSGIHWSPSEYLLQGDGSTWVALHPDSTVQRPYFQPQDEEMSIGYDVRVSTGPEGLGCEATAYILVNNYLPVHIPNAFTPNGDGLNDTWVIRGLAKYPQTVVKVYDRWGTQVFGSGTGYKNPWDGTANSGKQLPFGTYYYVADFLGSEDETDYKAEGWVIILE